MNRGLNFYGIILVTIATILVFSITDFGVVHATTGIDLDDNPAQSSQVPDLKSDSNDNDDTNTNNDNDDTNTNNDNDDTNTNNDKSSTTTATTSTSNTNNDDTNTNNDKSSTGASSTTTSTSTSTTTATTSNDNVPMSIPFNSNMADESDDEKDYSSIIPFP